MADNAARSIATFFIAVRVLIPPRVNIAPQVNIAPREIIALWMRFRDDCYLIAK